MEENIISWNVPNFVTVGIMGVVMFTLFGMLAQLYKAKMGG